MITTEQSLATNRSFARAPGRRGGRRDKVGGITEGPTTDTAAQARLTTEAIGQRVALAEVGERWRIAPLTVAVAWETRALPFFFGCGRPSMT
jgi:hypothetical protein